MKRLWIPFLHLAWFLAVRAPALSQNTVSVPVGFARWELPRESSALVSMPFLPFDDRIQAVFSNQFVAPPAQPGVCIVRQWDPVAQVYVSATTVYGTGDSSCDNLWFDDIAEARLSAATIRPGAGFWVENHAAIQREIYLAGRVVLAPSMTVFLYPGLTLLGYPYSTSASVDAGALPASHAVTHLDLAAGYWFQHDDERMLEWTVTCPYPDLYPSDGGPPQVVSMEPGANGKDMRLTIVCTGARGETLDVFYQDLLSRQDVFTTASFWKIAAQDLPTEGQGIVTWTDRDAATSRRMPFNGLTARYYLVGRADIDSDGDGIPDARETFVMGTNPNRPTAADEVPDIPAASVAPDASSPALSPAPAPEIQAVEAPAERPAGPRSAVIFVDAVGGSDRYDGRSEYARDRSGPKSSINAALAVSQPGDTLIIKEGTYVEDVTLSGIAARTVGRVHIRSPGRSGAGG